MSLEDKYARSIAKVVVGQLMAAEGLDSVQRSTIDILADLLMRYIVEVGSQSHTHAESLHRTECSPMDVALALKNMGQTLPDLLEYAQKLEESSLVQNVSDFPLRKTLPTPPSFADCGETPPSHIPSFLPAFPDPHTLMETEQFVSTKHRTTHTRQQQLSEQQQLGEAALLRLEAREHPESAPLQSAKQRLDAAEETQPIEKEEKNAFLAPVLWETGGAPPPKLAGMTAGARAAPTTAAVSSAEPLNIEWTVPESNGTSVPDLNFDAFQMTGFGMADAYGEDGGDVAVLAGGARRRRLLTSSEARVKEILSSRVEDAEMAYGTEDAAMFDQEMI